VGAHTSRRAPAARHTCMRCHSLSPHLALAFAMGIPPTGQRCIYIYIYICLCVCVCGCGCVCDLQMEGFHSFNIFIAIATCFIKHGSV